MESVTGKEIHPGKMLLYEMSAAVDSTEPDDFNGWRAAGQKTELPGGMQLLG